MEAVVVGTYNRASLMESSPVIPGSPYFIMAYDTAKKMTGIIDQTGVLTLEVSDEHLEDVLSAVQKIADENGKIEVNTIKQTISSIQKYYDPSIKTFYMISAILFIFGAISLMNMLMVDFQNRKREFGLFEAVGTTQNQLKGMLNREIGIYLSGSLIISFRGQCFKCHCMRTTGCCKSLYYFKTPVDISVVTDCCTDGNIFCFLNVCKIGVEENEYSFCYTR